MTYKIVNSAFLAVLGAVATFTVAVDFASAAIPHRDISYDQGTPPADPNLNALDVYQPDGGTAADDRPVVVYVHGGALAGRRQAQPDHRQGEPLHQRRLRLRQPELPTLAAGSRRRSIPTAIRFPDHPDDVGEALGWLDDNIDDYGGDPTRLLLIGHSAGAHLVSLVSTDPRYAERNGVEPWQILGTVPLDGDAYDVTDRIAEVEGSDAANTFYNAFATPAENAADNTWVEASPIAYAEKRDPRHLLVTQAGAPGRVVDAQAMASALGQDPDGVFQAPYNHEGVNDAVGGADDTAGETVAIMDFFRSMVADSADPKASFAKRPAKKIRTSGKRAKVKFKLDSSQARSTYACRLDSPKLKPCDRIRDR